MTWLAENPRSGRQYRYYRRAVLNCCAYKYPKAWRSGQPGLISIEVMVTSRAIAFVPERMNSKTHAPSHTFSFGEGGVCVLVTGLTDLSCVMNTRQHTYITHILIHEAPSESVQTPFPRVSYLNHHSNSNNKSRTDLHFFFLLQACLS